LNTKECSSASVSTKCNSGFYVVSNACSACPSGADTCDATGCLTPLNGFYKDGTNCKACGLNVATCTSWFSASTCNSGYFKTSSGDCSRCPNGASTCTSTSSATTCLSGFNA